MTVAKFKKGEDPYNLIIVTTSGEYHVLRDVVSHDDVTSMEYFPTLSVMLEGRRFPMVFNWNELKFYWQAESDEADIIQAELEAVETEWHEGLEDDAPN